MSRVQPLQTMKVLKDGYSLIFDGKKVILNCPVFKTKKGYAGGIQASKGIVCRSEREAIQIYERLRNEQV